jgi:hypothetical protein
VVVFIAVAIVDGCGRCCCGAHCGGGGGDVVVEDKDLNVERSECHNKVT